MKNHHEVGHFKNRLMIVLLSLAAVVVMAGQSFAATLCSSCHRMPPLDSVDGSRQPSTGAFKGSHQKHMGATADPAECTKCHGNTNYNSTHAATSSYLIQMKSNINNYPATGTTATYNKIGGAPFAQSTNPTMATCSNVNCHYEKTSTLWGDTAVDCNSCHDAQQATASHSKHLSSAAYGATITCSTCHPNYGTTSFSHATSAGKHAIVVNLTNNYGGVGVTNISWLPSQPKNYGSCSNVYCHSNGNGHYISQIYTNQTWGNQPLAGCNLCHPTLSSGHTKHVGSLPSEINFYNYTSTKSNGNVYKFGCANCHPFTVSSHINNSVDVVLTKSASGGFLKNLNLAGATITAGGKCSNVYCHSNGYLSGTFKCATTLAWTDKFDNYTALSKGRKDKCAWCHGNSPNTNPSTMPGSAAHTAHTVGIHYDDIYNGVSKKLLISGGQTVNAAHGRGNRSTTINCNMCHAATVSTFMNDFSAACSGCHKGPAAPQGLAAISQTANHVNGKVDVAFIGQKISTKAQVATSAFAAYTAVTSGGWSRNSRNLPFKTYTSSYDVTKANLSAVAGWSQASGCSNVACHANITVKWTDAVTCTSCHTRLK